jgi:uncharacterized protein involved in outer membrane biogenesis
LGRLIATLATILILVLGAAFAVPAFVDWNQYRSVIEKATSELIGQKVAILGDIDITLLPEPHIRAASVAAGIGEGRSTFATAEAVDVSLSLPALMSQRIEASAVKLVRPHLTLDFNKTTPIARPAAEAAALKTEIKSVEIQGGRLSVFSKNGPHEALSVTRIDGIAAASAQGGSNRFTGHFTYNGRTYDAKIAGALTAENGLRISAGGTEALSKVAFQADGSFSGTSGEPAFEGTVTVSIPQTQAAANRLPFDIQIKSSTNISLSGATFTDLVLSLDPLNRAQVLAGSGEIALASKTANFALQAQSLDAGVILASQPAGPKPAPGDTDWNSLETAAENLLWLYPGYSVNLSLDVGLLELKGESIEGLKLHGSRKEQRWLFDRAAATLPGGTALRLAGTLTGDSGTSQFVATAALEGKNAGRLVRWISPPAQASKAVPGGPFNLQGAVTLSRAAMAFEGVTGTVDGTPVKASLRLDGEPRRRLQLSLSGDSFDFSAFGGAAETASTWPTGLAQFPLLFAPEGRRVDTADIDLTAGVIKTSSTEVRNVAVHLKLDQDSIAVSKLNAETASGLIVRGNGLVPLRSVGQGRFDGRIDAQSPQAVVQASALLGYGRGLLERRANDLAPAALSIAYSSDSTAGIATAQVIGSLGTARIEGRGQLKGSLDAWREGQVSAQFRATQPDGNKLLALLFPNAALPPGASISPGLLTVGFTGTPERLETSAALSSGILQLQFDGISGAGGRSPYFKGKVSAASQTPEQFLPPTMLALLGGDPKANLRISTALSAAPGRIEADELKAESPRNAVTGRFTADATGDVTRLDGNLKADQASLPQLLGYFLTNPADDFAAVLPAALGSPAASADIWSGRPFALQTLKSTAGNLALTAKTLKLTDGLTLSDARLHASLDGGRLDLDDVSGRTLGGTFKASVNLTAKESVASAEADISFSGGDLAALAAPGIVPFASGRGSLSVFVAGQGLSPRGLISVLQGRGAIHLSGGVLSKLSPAGLQKSADELLSRPQPLTEEAITKKVLESIQSTDFAYAPLKIPVTVNDGILEVRRAPFRGRDGTMRAEVYVDLGKAQADTTWDMRSSSSNREYWPAVKVMLSGQLRELGGRPRTVSAEDFIHAVTLRKMEGDLNRLENLGTGKPPPAAAPAWTASQEPTAKKGRKTKGSQDERGDASVTAPTGAKARPTSPPQAQSFEQRMRDALQNLSGTPPTR